MKKGVRKIVKMPLSIASKITSKIKYILGRFLGKLGRSLLKIKTVAKKHPYIFAIAAAVLVFGSFGFFVTKKLSRGEIDRQRKKPESKEEEIEQAIEIENVVPQKKVSPGPPPAWCVHEKVEEAKKQVEEYKPVDTSDMSYTEKKNAKAYEEWVQNWDEATYCEKLMSRDVSHLEHYKGELGTEFDKTYPGKVQENINYVFTKSGNGDEYNAELSKRTSCVKKESDYICPKA